MDDARNLQYGIGFDTADAETSVENLGEKVETLEENIGAVEVGAQQMGACAGIKQIRRCPTIHLYEERILL